MKDLIVISPDGTYAAVLERLFARPQSLRIRVIEYTIVKDALHDSSGALVDLLRPHAEQYRHAMVVRDLEGSGAENIGAAELQASLKAQMTGNGWPEARCQAIVVDPEIEAWLRLPSLHMEHLVSTQSRLPRPPDPRPFDMVIEDMIAVHSGRLANGKPRRPKEVFEACLRHYRIPRSNALYGELAAAESLRGCVVESFTGLCNTLREWFPPV